MNNPVVNALAQMNLEPGRSYFYRVKGLQVEVRVLEELPVEANPATLDESEAKLEAWVELPPRTAVHRTGDAGRTSSPGPA